MRDRSSACGPIVTNDLNSLRILINIDSSTRVSIENILFIFTLFFVNFVFNYFFIIYFYLFKYQKLMKQNVIFNSNSEQTL